MVSMFRVDMMSRHFGHVIVTGTPGVASLSPFSYTSMSLSPEHNGERMPCPRGLFFLIIGKCTTPAASCSMANSGRLVEGDKVQASRMTGATKPDERAGKWRGLL